MPLKRHPNPYVWHKTGDQIFDSLAAYCQRINDSGHEAAAFGPNTQAGQ